MGITQKVLIGALSISLFSACEFSASPQASLADTPNSPTDSPPEIQKCSLEEETALESQMTRVLSEDTSPYAFSFRLERRDGRRFEFQKDGATFDTVFESASSSKLVTSLIILRLVDKGILKLSDRHTCELRTYDRHDQLWQRASSGKGVLLLGGPYADRRAYGDSRLRSGRLDRGFRRLQASDRAVYGIGLRFTFALKPAPSRRHALDRK